MYNEKVAWVGREFYGRDSLISILGSPSAPGARDGVCLPAVPAAGDGDVSGVLRASSCPWGLTGSTHAVEMWGSRMRLVGHSSALGPFWLPF